MIFTLRVEYNLQSFEPPAIKIVEILVFPHSFRNGLRKIAYGFKVNLKRSIWQRSIIIDEWRLKLAHLNYSYICNCIIIYINKTVCCLEYKATYTETFCCTWKLIYCIGAGNVECNDPNVYQNVDYVYFKYFPIMKQYLYK